MIALLMLLVGYSDRFNPEAFPMLACLGLFFPFALVANMLFVPIWIFVKWQRLWIPIIAFVLAYVPIRTFIPINFPSVSQPPEDCIKVVSYNVCGFGGNWKYEHAVDTVASYLQRMDADIVCLQEDRGGKGGSGFDKMKELYPYNDTIHFSNDAIFNSVGIHTRYPIIRKERLANASRSNGSIAYYLQVDSDTVLIINNHLEATHLTKDERERYQDMLKGEVERDSAETEFLAMMKKLAVHMADRAVQARTVNEYVETHSQYPIILCGDFNDTPISYAYHTVAGSLTDCFVSVGCGFGISFNLKGFNLRIDHMMCSDFFEPIHCFVDSKMDASDHYPVVCWLKKASKP
jgi:endonuclease/exonuclease/phosphatase family metal-dependent hydrolase